MELLDYLKYLSWRPIAGTIVAYYAALAFYRLFLHPLARFPGPKLAALTRYYEAYYDVVCNGQYTFKIAELHKKYGPIIRISPYELHINDPAYYEKLYRQDGRWNKYAWSYDAFSAKPSTICTVDHELHRRRRAPLNPFFSKAAVARQQGAVQRLADRLCDRIAEYAGPESTTTVTLGSAVSAFTRDVATEFVLGKNYDNLGAANFNDDMTAVLQSSGAIWRLTKHVPWFGPTMKALPLSFVEKIADAGTKSFLGFLQDMMRLAKDIMAAEAAATTSTKQHDPDAAVTVVHAIIRSDLPPEEKTFDRVNDDLATIAGAAFETTAQTLRMTLYYIYSDPAVLRRLRAELAAAGSGTSEIPLAALEQLPYLTAVLTEGLRLSPGLATRLARIAPDRDLEYGGKWRIPAGTPVGMTALLMHLDERVYPDPKRFDPDRWLVGGAEARHRLEKSFGPFSRGTRICLGMHLAWAEMYIVLAKLVQRFDFEFDGAGPKDVDCVSDQFIVGTADQSGIRAFVKPYKG